MIRDINTFRQEFKHAQGWWNDLRFPAAAAGQGAAAPTYDTTNLGYVFSDNPPANQELQFICQLPHDWIEGSTVDVHIHWTLSEDDGAADEDVKWDVLWRWYEKSGGDTNAGWTTAETTVDVSSFTQWNAVITELAELSGSGKTISSILELRLQRDTADAADDHPHDALLKELDIHYKIDQPGSLHEYGKWDVVSI